MTDSQDTQQMLSTDISSLTELQQKQNDNVVVIHDSMENKMNEQVLRLRELHKMIGNDVSLMTEFDTKFQDLINNTLDHKGNQNKKRKNHHVDFTYTGSCNKRNDKRKGY